MPRPESFIRIIESEFPADRLTYQKAIATFHPESAEEAAQLFRLANRAGQKLFITGFGNHIDPLGEPFEQMITVRSDRLNDIVEIAAADLYVRVEAGFPLKEINVELAQAHAASTDPLQAGLFLPHADLPYVGSVGGAIAAGMNARLGKHDLPLKKYLIAGEVVTPEGEIIRPGSTCFKSVSGYDIVKLLWNSWGLLGFVVTATFRVLPVTARSEYAALALTQVSRAGISRVFSRPPETTDESYAWKIREKFDPRGIFPLV